MKGSFITETSGDLAAHHITTTEIVGFLAEEFKAAHDIWLLEDSISLWRLMVAADEARQALATADSTTVTLRHIHNQKHLVAQVSREGLRMRRK